MSTFDIIATNVMWNMFFVSETLFCQMQYSEPHIYNKLQYLQYGIRFVTGFTTLYVLVKYY